MTTGTRREATRDAGRLQEIADTMLVALREGRLAGLSRLPELHPVRVRVSGRLTRSAGTYRPDGDVAISAHYLAAHGVEGARGVLLHELAHHVVRSVHGRKAAPHGREFRAVATALAADLRAEGFAAPRLVYFYRCPTCGVEWRRGRRLQRGRRYSCARCSPVYDERHRLRFAGKRREGSRPRGAEAQK